MYVYDHVICKQMIFKMKVDMRLQHVVHTEDDIYLLSLFNLCVILELYLVLSGSVILS